MYGSHPIRLLTALLVATWSPGHYCCCQRAAAEPAPPADDWVAASAPAVSEPKACCLETAPDTAPGGFPATVTTGCAECPSDGGHRPVCGCISAAGDVVVPTGLAANSSFGAAAEQLDLLSELPAIDVAVVTARRPLRACRGSPRPALAQTLLSLHCLLTT